MKKAWKNPMIETLTAEALASHINVAAMSRGDCLFGDFR